MWDELNRNGLKWSLDDVDYLMICAGTVEVETIARHLKRTVSAIVNKASELKISLIVRKCKYEHLMTQRPNGRWRCNVCHSIGERIRRNDVRNKT